MGAAGGGEGDGMKRTPLRRQSKKHRRRAAEAKPWREQLKARVGKCEMCGCPWDGLEVHEIANGRNRQKALDKPFAVLVLCNYCNVHEATDKAKWPDAKQLALLKRSRPEDYDLAAYNLLFARGPDRVTAEEVEAAVMELEGRR